MEATESAQHQSKSTLRRGILRLGVESQLSWADLSLNVHAFKIHIQPFLEAIHHHEWLNYKKVLVNPFSSLGTITHSSGYYLIRCTCRIVANRFLEKICRIKFLALLPGRATSHHHPRQSASLLRSLVIAPPPISSSLQQRRRSVVSAKSSVAVFKLAVGSAVLAGSFLFAFPLSQPS
ncbi:hypothetical protein PIB30_079220 [Stylosanthes scabra]|uniref:Uncharacterized protein n=1 Tax=Stylosanthes scabra TaxID=79078 RepID=A0ABU6XSV5_9FABA|nr:hypothetical protein [Stylosanthes scabra]